MASKPSGRGGGGGGGRGGGGGDGGGGSGSGGDSDGRRTGLSARAFGGAQPPPPPKQGKKRTAPAAPAAAAAAAAGSAAGDAASAAGSAHVTRSKQPRLAATDATARISAMLSDVAATRAADPRSTAVAAAAAGQTPCFNYHTEGGVCANGSLCNYSHGEVDPSKHSPNWVSAQVRAFKTKRSPEDDTSSAAARSVAERDGTADEQEHARRLARRRKADRAKRAGITTTARPAAAAAAAAPAAAEAADGGGGPWRMEHTYADVAVPVQLIGTYLVYTREDYNKLMTLRKSVPGYTHAFHSAIVVEIVATGSRHEVYMLKIPNGQHVKIFQCDDVEKEEADEKEAAAEAEDEEEDEEDGAASAAEVGADDGGGDAAPPYPPAALAASPTHARAVAAAAAAAASAAAATAAEAVATAPSRANDHRDSLHQHDDDAIPSAELQQQQQQQQQQQLTAATAVSVLDRAVPLSGVRPAHRLAQRNADRLVALDRLAGDSVQAAATAAATVATAAAAAAAPAAAAAAPAASPAAAVVVDADDAELEHLVDAMQAALDATEPSTKKFDSSAVLAWQATYAAEIATAFAVEMEIADRRVVGLDTKAACTLLKACFMEIGEHRGWDVTDQDTRTALAVAVRDALKQRKFGVATGPDAWRAAESLLSMFELNPDHPTIFALIKRASMALPPLRAVARASRVMTMDACASAAIRRCALAAGRRKQ